MDRIQGGVGDNPEGVAVGKNIGQHSQRQSFTVRNERDLHTALDFLADKVDGLRHLLMMAFFICLFLIVVVAGVAVFVGNQQINTLAATQTQQLNLMTRRMDLMSQQIRDLERTVSRLEQALSNGRAPGYIPPYYEDLP